MKWQEVTKEQICSHWDGFENIEEPISPDFEIAKYMNAYAWGDISGDGIDVRCEYQEEIIDAWNNSVDVRDIMKELEDIDWDCTLYEYHMVAKKGDDVAIFELSNKCEAGYLMMSYVGEDTKTPIEHYFDNDEDYTFDIVSRFQKVCKEYIDCTDDGGYGMRNFWVDTDTMIQVYPNDEYHNVFILKYDEDGEHDDFLIKDFDEKEQEKLLNLYTELIIKNKKEMEQQKQMNTRSYTQEEFVAEFGNKGLCECECNEDEVIYCDKFGNLYHWLGDWDGKEPLCQHIIYPKPSKLNWDTIGFLIGELRESGMLRQMDVFNEWLKLDDEDEDKEGLPYAHMYRWIWEEGLLDHKAEFIPLVKQETKEQIQQKKRYRETERVETDA